MRTLATIPEYRFGSITQIDMENQVIYILSAAEGRNVVAWNFQHNEFQRLVGHYLSDRNKLVSYVAAGRNGDEAVNVQIYWPRGHVGVRV